MMATVPASAAAGPSTNASKIDRQHQRRWVQLVEAWRTSSPDQAHGAYTRDQLVQEISQHAHTLCRTVRDRHWLLSAFQMGVHAVLFPPPDAADEDADEAARVEQLGQQLLQLATHSVASPLLRDLHEQNASPSRVDEMSEALEWFEQLSRRLPVYGRLRALAEMIDLLPLPLALVLEEKTPTVLLGLAALPQAVNLIGPVLQSYPWLVHESAPLRLPLLAQLLTSGSGSKQKLDSLASSGLLIGWKEGKEASIWSSSQVQGLRLGEIVQFYRETLAVVKTNKGEEAAHALLDVLTGELQGNDALQAITELRSSLPEPVSQAQTDRSSNSVPTAKVDTRFDLDSIQSLASQVAALPSNDESRREFAKQLGSSDASRLIQLIDTNDSAPMRQIVLEVVSNQAAASQARTSLAYLTAAALYARPAVGGFTINLTAPWSFLTQASKTVSLLRGTDGGKATPVGDIMRATLGFDPHSVIPACQLQAHLSSKDAHTLANEMHQHLSWLCEIWKLVGSRSDISSNIDLCWVAAYCGDHHEAGEGRSIADEQQKTAFTLLLDNAIAAFPPPDHVGARIDHAGIPDTKTLQFRARWDDLFSQLLSLCTPGVAFGLVPQEHAVKSLLSRILQMGDIELYRTLSASSTTTSVVSPAQLEDLVLGVSTALFDAASVASTRTKEVRLALQVLSALPGECERVRLQRGFIEAACRLSSFKIKSSTSPGEVVKPSEIRLKGDRMELIARLLATQEDAYRSPELVLDIANRLCATGSGLTEEDRRGQKDGAEGEREWGLSPSERTMIEARTLAMLADSATSAEDFEDAFAFCQRLVDKVSVLRNRASSSSSSSSSSTSSTSAGSALAKMLPTALELGWKSCLQLSKHPLWEDTPSRISMLAHAMTLCPPSQLGAMLQQWQALDQQLVREVEQGKQFASTKKAAAAAGAGWLAAGGAGGRGVGDLISAQTAASVGAGLVGTAANLLPLSFSPLSYFGNAPSAGGNRGGGGERAKERGAEVDARTAKLFDFDSVSGGASGSAGSGYVDPAERAVRAARAARDFLGWKTDQRNNDSEQTSGAAQGQGLGQGLGGFSLSRGVGWLIGEGDHR